MATREERDKAGARAEEFEKRARDALNALAEPPGPIGIKLKHSAARKLFEAAANDYKVSGRWRAAARILANVGQQEEKLGHILEAATFYAEAGDVAKRTDHDLAIEMYQKAIATYSVVGQFQIAAYLQREIALIYEDDLAWRDAAQAYLNASEMYKGDEDVSHQVLMLHRAGVIYVEMQLWADAARAFRRAAAAAKGDNILQYRVAQIMFEAGLCFLATGDIPETEEYIARGALDDNNFAICRERRFLEDVITAARTVDVDKFLDHCWNLDYVVELKPHQLRILRRVYAMFVSEVAAMAQRRKERLAAEQEKARRQGINKSDKKRAGQT